MVYYIYVTHYMAQFNHFGRVQHVNNVPNRGIIYCLYLHALRTHLRGTTVFVYKG